MLACIATAWGMRRAASTTYTDELEGRIDLLEQENEQLSEKLGIVQRDLDLCKEGKDDMRRQNFMLMEKLLGMGHS